MDANQLELLVPAVVVGGGAVFAVWRKWFHPRWRNFIRFFARVDETINGRSADIDAWGRERAPAVPSLGERMTSLEDAVRDRAELEKRVTDVENRVTVIEGGHQVERITGNIAQAKVVDAIAEANRRKGAREGAIEGETT